MALSSASLREAELMARALRCCVRPWRCRSVAQIAQINASGVLGKLIKLVLIVWVNLKETLVSKPDREPDDFD
jgi:hypothetical protein